MTSISSVTDPTPRVDNLDTGRKLRQVADATESSLRIRGELTPVVKNSTYPNATDVSYPKLDVTREGA